MQRKYDKSIEDKVAECARLAEHWFKVRFDDRDAFETRLRSGLQFMGSDPNADNKINLTRHLGLFSLDLFQAMICGGSSFEPRSVSIVWERLLDAGLIVNALPKLQGTPLADHQILDPLLLWHLQDDTFANLFAHPARLLERYSEAIAAIDVVKNGDLSRGTAFVVVYHRRQYLVTCRHNVDPADGISVSAITNETGNALHIADFTFSDRYDIAIAKVTQHIAGPCFALSEQVEVFDEVFTLGYPWVPRADAILLGHRGELNARATLYMEKCPAYLISNLVSPGSSGGPVVTRDGHCAGMTIRWLEGEWGDTETLEKMRFSAALPAELLRQEISLVGK